VKKIMLESNLLELHLEFKEFYLKHEELTNFTTLDRLALLESQVLTPDQIKLIRSFLVVMESYLQDSPFPDKRKALLNDYYKSIDISSNLSTQLLEADERGMDDLYHHLFDEVQSEADRSDEILLQLKELDTIMEEELRSLMLVEGHLLGERRNHYY